jgi:hypothetical protein
MGHAKPRIKLGAAGLISTMFQLAQLAAAGFYRSNVFRTTTRVIATIPATSTTEGGTLSKSLVAGHDIRLIASVWNRLLSLKETETGSTSKI